MGENCSKYPTEGAYKVIAEKPDFGSSIFFFTSAMLKNNFMIEESFSDPDTTIKALHIREENGMYTGHGQFILHNKGSLSNIQIYGIVKDIVELYNQNSFQDFIQIIDDHMVVDSILTEDKKQTLGKIVSMFNYVKSEASDLL